MRNFKRLLLTLTCMAVWVLAGNYATAQISGDLPPNAVSGKCYAKCLIPDQYETVTEQILLKEASARIEVVPAVYETVSEQVLVKEPYRVLEVVPASFTTQSEQLMVKEPSERLEYVPPVYQTVTEQVLVAPASTKWTKGRATRNCLSANPEDCKVWCLTEVAAQYKTVTKQVLASPATTRSVPIPAEYKTITRAVTQNPATTREREIPADYRTVTKQVLQTPATTREVEVPAEYSTITTKKLVRTGGFTDWVEVLCNAKITASKIAEIQQALNARGYSVSVTNRMDTATSSALNSFQNDNNLPTGNLNIDTLKALGVSH